MMDVSVAKKGTYMEVRIPAIMVISGESLKSILYESGMDLREPISYDRAFDVDDFIFRGQVRPEEWPSEPTVLG